MKHQSALTQAAFDSLLAWLAPGNPGSPYDRDRAGQKYEQIRQRLIKIFTCRGCSDPDELADLTIERVTRKVPEIAAEYQGDPALYFYGVAQKVFLESLRRRPPLPLDPPPAPSVESEASEREFDCLERCLAELAPGNRELILENYRNDRRAKIDYRKGLAARLGIAPNALRIRVHRIRTTLQECVRGCLGQNLPV